MRAPGRALWGALAALWGCTTGGTYHLPDAQFDDAPPPGVDGGTEDDAGPVDPCDPGATIGAPCTTADDCDDECFCTGIERCVEGFCEAGPVPCADTVECTRDACDDALDICVFEPDDEVCADGDACNGAEKCEPSIGCIPQAPPFCNDESSCTVDSCDPAVGCVYTPRDLDGDGFRDGRCGGEDCDDDPRFGTQIYPGAPEDCRNRRDDDCDGLRDYLDTDCVPTNDACDTAEAITGPGTFGGTTRGLTDALTVGCRTSGVDAVFRLTVTELADVSLTLSGGGSGAAIAIRPWDACASGPDDKCGTGSPPTILRRSLAPGDYAVIVETSSAQAFDLTVALGEPTAVPPIDVCDGETVDVSAGGTFTGLFIETEDDYALTCHAGKYREAAYRFTLTEPKDVFLQATTGGTTSTPTTYLALTRDCADAAGTLSCLSGRPGSLTRRGLEPGTYYVLVESSSADATTWSLDVEITDPAPRAPGDACGTAVDIGSGSGMADLATAEFDVGTSCGGATTAYRDLFYTFTLAETLDVRLTTEGAGYHFVSLSTACGETGSELRCRAGNAPLGQSWRSLPAGTYFVTVSTSLRSGNVTVRLETSPATPVPPNDRCEGAIDVSRGDVRSDTLSGFEDDVLGCGSSGMPDAFYLLDLTRDTEVLVSARRPTGMSGNITLTLREGSCTGTQQACDTGQPAVINQVLPRGTYYLVVEQPASTEGDFELRVVLF